MAPVRQRTLPLGRAVHGGETAAGTQGADAPVEGGTQSFHSLRRTAVYVTRMYGGVTGKAGDRLPMSIRRHGGNAVDTNALRTHGRDDIVRAHSIDVPI